MEKTNQHSPEWIAARAKELKPLRDKAFDAWKINPTISVDNLKDQCDFLKGISGATINGWLARWNVKKERIEKGVFRKKTPKSRPVLGSDSGAEVYINENEDLVLQCQTIVQAYLDKYVAAIDKVKALNKEIGQFRATLQEKDRQIGQLGEQVKIMKNRAKAGQRPLEQLRRVMAVPGD